MTTSGPTKSVLSPVQQAERIQLVDILRGFALFGILLVNMALFAHPVQSLVFPVAPGTPWYDYFAEWLIHFLGDGKFYSLFSLLFGLGLTLQMDRIEARGGRFVPLYLRRLLILLGIGVLHAFLIWVGDILIFYALFGVLLLLFRKAQPRTLLTWAVILLAIPVLFQAATALLVEVGRSLPEGAEQIEQTFADVEAGYRSDMERADRVYAKGGFGEITSQRVYDYVNFMFFGTLYTRGLNALAMFLLGVYFGKRRIFQDLEANRPLFRRLLAWGSILGLTGNAISATVTMPITRVEPSWPYLLATVAQGIGAPMLCLAYISAIALLTGIPAWNQRLKLLTPVGQMALTNYLSQSIICTLIFYGYGFGLFGTIGASAGIVLTIVIYLIQIPVSHWWMKRFRYGPAEWLWRSLTYWQIQPMRRTPASAILPDKGYPA